MKLPYTDIPSSHPLPSSSRSSHHSSPSNHSPHCSRRSRRSRSHTRLHRSRRHCSSCHSSCTCHSSPSRRQSPTHSYPVTLTTSVRHREIRLEADKNYRKNAEKMSLQYSKRKRHQANRYVAGDVVSVRIPRNERSASDMSRLICCVIEVKNNLYRLQ